MTIGDLTMLYTKLRADHADHVPLYTAYLRALITNGMTRNAATIVGICDRIAALVDEGDVLRRAGIKADVSETPQVVKW